jgi:hypothetical protein
MPSHSDLISVLEYLPGIALQGSAWRLGSVDHWPQHNIGMISIDPEVDPITLIRGFYPMNKWPLDVHIEQPFLGN